MTLQQWFADKPRGSKVQMTRALGISKTYMSMLISGRETPSAAMAVMIHQYTNGEVSREELRPDLFMEL